MNSKIKQSTAIVALLRTPAFSQSAQKINLHGKTQP